MKAVGRPNWFPRLGSSVCSSHFSEECFDRSGDKVTVRSDAMPTLMVHGNQEVSEQRDSCASTCERGVCRGETNPPCACRTAFIT
ncbi:hypothetical protein KUCAC02_033893 [Chaenocephalus aceratus]|nr:hypothetical protein KUCAC02_033893 [Chaenocephalus aceratus]